MAFVKGSLKSGKPTLSLLASTKATAKVAAADKGRQIVSGWGYYVGLGAHPAITVWQGYAGTVIQFLLRLLIPVSSWQPVLLDRSRIVRLGQYEIFQNRPLQGYNLRTLGRRCAARFRRMCPVEYPEIIPMHS